MVPPHSSPFEHPTGFLVNEGCKGGDVLSFLPRLCKGQAKLFLVAHLLLNPHCAVGWGAEQVDQLALCGDDEPVVAAEGEGEE